MTISATLTTGMKHRVASSFSDKSNAGCMTGGFMISTEKANAYICVSIHESSSDAKDYVPLYEERLTLIKAGSKEAATSKVQQLVKAAAHSYKNEGNQTISWSCRRIVEVTEVIDNALSDGAEIYGRYFRDLAAYERFETERKQRV
jgi:Domain of unknown function (DUF4288)